MKRAVIVLVMALFTATCQDSGSLFSPDDLGPPSESNIVDARTASGNPGFAFQPPLAPDFTIDGFDPTVVTRVEVCELGTATETTDTCVTDVWTSVEPVPVVDDQYQALWHLDESTEELETVAKADNPENVPFYRVQVFVGELRLGYLDLKFLDNGAAKKKVGDEVISVGTNRTIPINYELNQDAVAEQLGCTVGGTIIDCDAVLLPPGETQIVSVFSDNHGLAARAEITLPSGHDPLFFLLEHIENLTTPVGDGVPFFARATLFDTQGNEFTDDINVDRFVLCQAENVPISSFLDIRQHDDGETTILPTGRNTAECTDTDQIATNSAPSSWGERLRGRFAQVASVFLAQPLRALHGGLNTVSLDCCSEFDAVQWDYRVTGGGELSVGSSTTVLNLVTVFANDAGSVDGQVEYFTNGALTFKGVVDGFSIGSDGSGNTVVNICGDITEGPYNGAGNDGRFGLAIKDVAGGPDVMRENGAVITCSDLYGDTETSFPATMVDGDYVVDEREE